MDTNICWGEARMTYSEYCQFVSVPTDKRWGNGHKLKRQKKFFCEHDLTQEQVTGLVLKSPLLKSLIQNSKSN